MRKILKWLFKDTLDHVRISPLGWEIINRNDRKEIEAIIKNNKS